MDVSSNGEFLTVPLLIKFVILPLKVWSYWLNMCFPIATEAVELTEYLNFQCGFLSTAFIFLGTKHINSRFVDDTFPSEKAPSPKLFTFKKFVTLAT